jgi:hypothetical protein
MLRPALLFTVLSDATGQVSIALTRTVPATYTCEPNTMSVVRSVLPRSGDSQLGLTVPAASSTFATALRSVPVGSLGVMFVRLKRPPMNRSAPSESRASPLIRRLVLGSHARI